jgi:hypothetical protein
MSQMDLQTRNKQALIFLSPVFWMVTIPAAYEKITPPCPLLSIETNK